MKRETDDIELGRMLKQIQPEAGSNEWFTRKVMNRLPEKRSPGLGWLLPAAFALSFIICLGGWAYFLHNLNLNLILVRDLVSLCVLLVTTIVVIWQFVHSLLFSD